MGLFGFGKSKKLENEIINLQQRNESLQQEIENLRTQNISLQSKLLPEHSQIEDLKRIISDLSAQADSKKNQINLYNTQIHESEKKISDLQKNISQLNSKLSDFNDEIDMLECGFYRPTYEFANSDLYKSKLTEVRALQKSMIKNNTACTGNMNWSVNGSTSQGNKMVKDMQKLLLRAFNVECDDIISNVKLSNKEKSIDKIYNSAESISKLGKIMLISINDRYIKLKIEELNLAIDFAQKKEEEKERIRELKEQEREAKKAQKEIEEARKKLEKEQTHYTNALQTICKQLEKNPDNADLLIKKEEIESNLNDTEKAIEDVDYRQANQRAGYVYVISNIGAFGENVYKIGMTRRLEPMERINELSGASVPFNFDVHALIFTEDAPGLETALHKAFEKQKVNKINTRREFFRITLDEIKKVVRDNFDKTVEWIDFPEAEQYRQSLLLENEI